MFWYDIAQLFRSTKAAIGIGVFMAVLCHVAFRFFGTPLPEAALYACFFSAAVPTFFLSFKD